MTTTDSDGTGDPEGFSEAMIELQRIVAELESDTLDVDQLATRVERAATLVSWCRERIDSAQFAVTEILERLDPTDQGAVPATGDDRGDA